MPETIKPVTPAVSLLHSLFIKPRTAEEFEQFGVVDSQSGLVEIPQIVWDEWTAAIDRSPLLRRIG